MIFISPMVGWLTGGPSGSDLYRTGDGGKTWQAETIAPPKEAQGADPNETSYSLPAFAVYSSSDVGITWKLESVEPNMPVSGRIASAVYDSHVLMSLERIQ
jgi:photosystem II stability/assembly factor-like uncharacterized protein